MNHLSRTLIGLGMLVAVPAWAGHESGNGGGVITCPDGFIDLLDFWEAEALKGLSIRRTENSLADQLEETLGELRLKNNYFLATHVESRLKVIQHQIKHNPSTFLPPDVSIAAPADARNSYVKKGCTLAGAALYNDTYDLLELDSELYARLGQTAVAGLQFHEAAYKLLRETHHVKDSIIARNITACAFAKEPCAELDPNLGVPKENYYVCSATRPANQLVDQPTKLILYPSEQNCSTNGDAYDGWRVQILAFGSVPAPTLTYVDFCPRIDISPYLDKETGDLRAGHQEVARSRSSEQRWKNIGLQRIIHTSVDSRGLLVNKEKFQCRRH